MQITVLCDNSVASPGPLLAEHGFACLVEAYGRRILFDTGQGRTLLPNATHLGKDLSALDAVILSHGHYDHAGGLSALLRRHPGQRIIHHPGVFQRRCWVGEEGGRDIGTPFTEAELGALGGRLQALARPTELFPGIWLSGEVPRSTPFELGDASLRLGEPERPAAGTDPVCDDLSLALVTDLGLVVIVGCAHAGLINILEHLRTVTGIGRVHTVLGGTHLGPVGDQQFQATVASLEHYNLARLGLSHCTGLKRSAELCQRWPDKAFWATVGHVVTL